VFLKTRRETRSCDKLYFLQYCMTSCYYCRHDTGTFWSSYILLTVWKETQTIFLNHSCHVTKHNIMLTCSTHNLFKMEFVFLQSKISNIYILWTSHCLNTVLAHIFDESVYIFLWSSHAFNPLCPLLNGILHYFMHTEISSANTAFTYAYGSLILVSQNHFMEG
jgi:hypothetical protein